MKALTAIGIFFMLPVVAYISMAFLYWQLDPSQWSEQARAFITIVITPVSLFLLVGYLLKDKMI